MSIFHVYALILLFGFLYAGFIEIIDYQYIVKTPNPVMNLTDLQTSLESNTTGFIHKVRVYLNPLQALIDQNAAWQGNFSKEINDLKVQGGVSKPVKFELIYRIGATHKNHTGLPPLVIAPGINCAKLFNSDPGETIRAELLQKRNKELVTRSMSTDFQIYSNTRHCGKYKKSKGYVTEAGTTDEEEFPIAYSILMYKSSGQVERLLRSIYRPQNSYCIHVDSKAKNTVHYAMRALANCFDNVFIASRSLPVIWGTLSVIEAEVVCMGDLWKKSLLATKKWKYFINLTGQEFPLKTNWELVQILKSFKGAIDIGHTASK